MRGLLVALILLILLHVLAAGGFVAWLGTSGRLSSERARQVVDTFRLTIAEQAERDEQAEAEAEEQRELQAQAAQLEAISIQGPRTLRSRLATEQMGDELAMHRLERLRRQTEDLRRQIERAKQVLAEQKSDLEAERTRFQSFLDRETELRQDEDFQQAVRMIEQLPSDQAKAMFQELLAQGEQEMVVQYLAAMQLRKAGKVLQEFETEQEIAQATELVEALRQRHVYPPAGQLAQEMQ